MKSKTAGITAKYQRMIDNIQWHLKTNKPTDKMELQKCYQQINDYREMIVDLETVASQHQHPVPDEAGEVYVWETKNPEQDLFRHPIINLTEKCHDLGWFDTKRGYWVDENGDSLGQCEWLRLSPVPLSGEDAGKGWISVEEKLPTEKDADENEKVLVYRNTNEGQKGLSKSIFDYFMVKNCDSDTMWQPLPPKP